MKGKKIKSDLPNLDWHLNNLIRRDRYQGTNYKDLQTKVFRDKNGRYTLGIPPDIPVVAADKDSTG